jgi:hypothetical protein
LLLVQTLPQAPQLLGLSCKFSQLLLPEQKVPLGQLVHWPLTHGPVEQALPQDPQLLGSLCMSEQVPLQGVWPLGQARQKPP